MFECSLKLLKRIADQTDLRSARSDACTHDVPLHPLTTLGLKTWFICISCYLAAVFLKQHNSNCERTSPRLATKFCYVCIFGISWTCVDTHSCTLWCTACCCTIFTSCAQAGRLILETRVQTVQPCSLFGHRGNNLRKTNKLNLNSFFGWGLACFVVFLLTNYPSLGCENSPNKNHVETQLGSRSPRF